MSDQDFRHPISSGNTFKSTESNTQNKLGINKSKIQKKKCVLVRKDGGQLLALSGNGHPAYAPVKLNIKTAVSSQTKSTILRGNKVKLAFLCSYFLLFLLLGGYERGQSEGTREADCALHAL